MKTTLTRHAIKSARLSLSIGIVLTTTLGYTADPIGIGIQSGFTELSLFQSKMAETGQRLRILQDHTRKFENDNTFVQFGLRPEPWTEIS